MHRGELNSKCSLNSGNRARENNSKSIRRFPLLFTSCVRQVYCARIGRLQTRYIRASSPQILYIFFIFNGTIAVILNYVAGIPARSRIRICQKITEKKTNEGDGVSSKRRILARTRDFLPSTFRTLIFFLIVRLPSRFLDVVSC